MQAINFKYVEIIKLIYFDVASSLEYDNKGRWYSDEDNVELYPFYYFYIFEVNLLHYNMSIRLSNYSTKHFPTIYPFSEPEPSWFWWLRLRLRGKRFRGSGSGSDKNVSAPATPSPASAPAPHPCMWPRKYGWLANIALLECSVLTRILNTAQ